MLKLDLYQPAQTGGSADLVDSTGAWDWIEPGSTVEGVGNVRAIVSDVKGSKFRIDYNSAPKTDHPWYASTDLARPSDMIFDCVQDLDPSFEQHIFQAKNAVTNKNAAVIIKANDIPERSEAHKSLRTVAERYVDRLEIEVQSYGPKEPIPCDSEKYHGRLRVKLWATDAEGGDFDFHCHQESDLPGSITPIGPDQIHHHGEDRRYWEMGIHNIRLRPKTRTKVLEIVGAANRHCTWHFAQQTGPDQEMNQVHCSHGLHQH